MDGETVVVVERLKEQQQTNWLIHPSIHLAIHSNSSSSTTRPPKLRHVRLSVKEDDWESSKFVFVPLSHLAVVAVAPIHQPTTDGSWHWRGQPLKGPAITAPRIVVTIVKK